MTTTPTQPLTAPPVRRFLSYSQLADYWSVSESQIRAWVADAGLPVLRLGRVVRFDRDAVDEWFISRAGSEDA